VVGYDLDEEDVSSPPSPSKMSEALLSTSNEGKADTLTRELFASELEEVEVLPWNELVTQRWRNLTHKGLGSEEREVLLKKYAPSEAVAFLKAPVLNPECRSALKNNSIVKRDKFHGKNQE